MLHVRANVGILCRFVLNKGRPWRLPGQLLKEYIFGQCLTCFDDKCMPWFILNNQFGTDVRKNRLENETQNCNGCFIFNDPPVCKDWKDIHLRCNLLIR